MKLFKKNKRIWHYICENGHKWEDKNSPGGGVFAKLTVCPQCRTEICMGNVYINGEKTQMGALHAAFRLKGKEKENMIKELKKETLLAKIIYDIK